MKNKQDLAHILINTACVLAVLSVTVPLLMIARYNYPSADDWSYGASLYHVIRSGGSLFDVIGAAFQNVQRNYIGWESRYSNVLLASFQPGVWGEQYYVVVPWLMIGSVICSEYYLAWSLLKNYGVAEQSKWLSIPIISLPLALQIMYTPFPEESFYWYTGAVNYTFMYAVSLVLFVLFLKLSTGKYCGLRYVLIAFTASSLAVLVGGNNFATSLSTLLTLILFSLYYAAKDRKALRRTWFVTALCGGGLLAALLGPGNEVRIASNFGGETTRSPLLAVWRSLVRSFTNICSWTDWKVVLLLLFLLPFIWIAVKNMAFGFRLPGVFTLLSFGLYASQITATMYVDGTTGGGRMAGILFFSYYLWILGNACYWTGWLCRRQNKLQRFLEQIIAAMKNGWSGMGLLIYCGIVGILLAAVIGAGDMREIASYTAYRDWRQGWVQQYGAEWEDRLEILKDDSVKNVVFTPLSVCPETLTYTDLQTEEGYVWVNSACAAYYGKDSVIVVAE